MNQKSKNTRAGFTMAVLLVAVVLVILLTIYTLSKTMRQVQNSVKEEIPETSVPAPTIQKYQQTLDSMKENINQNVDKEQKRINDAAEEMK